MNPQQQPVQPAPNYSFTPQAPAPAQPPAPAPAFDPEAFKNEVVEAVQGAIQPATPAEPVQSQQQPVQQPAQGAEPEYFDKDYDTWGALEKDTKKLVQDQVSQALQQTTVQQKEAQQKAAEQEKENQAAIDQSLGQLRVAGYLPPVNNQFDANDLGKQAENELIGYAVHLGTNDLTKAAQELKSRHDRGDKFDYKNKTWINTAQPSNQPSMFGSMSATPDSQPFQQMPQQMMPQMGPQNPYATVQQPQYPAGFNAPVNSGAMTGVGMQGQVPNVQTIRGANYDQLVDMYGRTQG